MISFKINENALVSLCYENLIITDKPMLDIFIRRGIIHKVNFLTVDDKINPQCFENVDAVFTENWDPIILDFEEYSIIRRTKDIRYMPYGVGSPELAINHAEMLTPIMDPMNTDIERVIMYAVHVNKIPRYTRCFIQTLQDFYSIVPHTIEQDFNPKS